MFAALTAVIERGPDLLTDDRFNKPPAARARNAATLTEIIEGWTRRRAKHEVMQAFAGKGIRCGAVLDTAEVLADPHLRERGTVFDLEHATRGKYSMIGCPVRLSDSPFEMSAAPLMGEHSEDVLTSIAGYFTEEVRELRNKGVI
jgi:formyl-CoA transferase